MRHSSPSIASRCRFMLYNCSRLRAGVVAVIAFKFAVICGYLLVEIGASML
jgi:hypothetical protein